MPERGLKPATTFEGKVCNDSPRQGPRLFPGAALGFRQSEEQRLAVGERDVSAYSASRTIFRLIALHRYVGSRRQRFLREAKPVKIVRAGPFDHPRDRLAIRAFDVDVNPRMWVRQLPLHDRSPNLDWFGLIELCGKRVMCQR